MVFLMHVNGGSRAGLQIFTQDYSRDISAVRRPASMAHRRHGGRHKWERYDMYSHLLVATDGSELGCKAVKQGVALAKALAARITIVTVTEPWHTFATGETVVAFPIEGYEASITKAADATLAEAAAMARDAGVSCETLHVKDSFPADGIIDVAQEKLCDLIVMSSHGRRGFSRLLLGSQANHVVTHSSVPVLIFR